jgi:D-erythronate 2-dehydrogenase
MAQEVADVPANVVLRRTLVPGALLAPAPTKGRSIRSMQVLVTGAAGMLGRKLAERLAGTGVIGGRKITRLRLHDIVEPAMRATAPFPVETAASDLAAAGEAEKLVAAQPEVIFHLAAIVSGEAEADFGKGYRVNLDGTRQLFEAVRRTAPASPPRLVFTSSIAAFGAPFPDTIDDEFLLAPLTSYGTQKAIAELLLADYSRRGFFDGIGIRLPTICVRPGAPNLAASGFFSNIIREPLNGQQAVLPVSDDVMHWLASPRAAVGFLVHAASLDTARLGARRNLTMPGVAATVADQIEALRKVAGDNVVERIRRQPDPAIARIVAGWPRRFDARRARELGFEADRSFDEIVRIHIEDELGGRFVA